MPVAIYGLVVKWLSRLPVTEEIAGSNPVEPAILTFTNYNVIINIMHESKTGKLILRGKLQAETVLGALTLTNADPDAAEQLRSSLVYYDSMSDPDAQVEHIITAPIDDMPHLIGNIQGSLQIMEQASDTLSEDKVAAEALVSIIESQLK